MKRPRFLTHWTGRGICTMRADLTPAHRAKYVERLRSLINEGFWMRRPTERLTGFSDTGEPVWIKYDAPMTCFTELRLSAAREHHAGYGLLGLVVDRAFVLDRFGAPVHYVRSNSKDAIVSNLCMHLDWIKKQQSDGIAGAETIMKNIQFLVGFCKNMSSSPDEEDFRFIEEHEWRIVHSRHQEKQGHLKESGREDPRYLIPFTRADIQMAVVPDEEVRAAICSASWFKEWLGTSTIPILTTEELEHF